MVSASIFLEDRVTVMGIVNTTPDSFSDGGELFRGSPPELDVDRAVEVGCERVRQGAHVLDVGGESTRPARKRCRPPSRLSASFPSWRGSRSAWPFRFQWTRVLRKSLRLRWRPELAW